MVRALIGAMITGLIAPSIGIYLVQRRLSLIGDGLGHVALTGVGLGLLTRTSPVLAAVVVAALGAVAIGLVRERGKASGDVALAIMCYGGISGGVVLVSMSAAQNSKSLVSYLFGSPLTTSRDDLVVIGVLGAAVLAVALLLRPWLFAVCHDEEYARVSGLPIRLLNITLAVTTAVTVTAAMRAVGPLLVSALMVVPVATAQQVTRGVQHDDVPGDGARHRPVDPRHRVVRAARHRAQRDRGAAGHRRLHGGDRRIRGGTAWPGPTGGPGPA